MNVGENIRKKRKEKGLTQKQLGELCGMADSAIRRYEANKVKPGIENFCKLATALDMKLDDLIGDDPMDKNISLRGQQKCKWRGGKNMRIDKIKLVTELLKRDLTQEQLAKIAGISRVTVNGIKAGRKCSDETGHKIADALQIDIKELLEE